MLPSSQLIWADRICASIIVGSFYRQLCNSFNAALVLLDSHFALAKSNYASVKPQFYLVTFSNNFIAFIKCFGGCYIYGLGLEPQWTKYSCASYIKKSALSLI